MGIYYNTYLYAGELRKPDDIKNGGDNQMCFKNGVILFEDKKCIRLGRMDPILEKYEVERGYVDAREVEKLLVKYYLEYVGLFDYSKGNVFLCETSYTSYDWPMVEYVTQNIKVSSD